MNLNTLTFLGLTLGFRYFQILGALGGVGVEWLTALDLIVTEDCLIHLSVLTHNLRTTANCILST